MTTIQIHPVAYVFTTSDELLRTAEAYSVVGTSYCVNIEFAIVGIEDLSDDERTVGETELLDTLKDCVKQGCSGDVMFFGE